MAKKRTEGIESERADTLISAITKDLKSLGAEVFSIGEEETPTDLRDWVSTGSSLLDLAISNRPNGGIPMGRIVEFHGLEGSGKSLLTAHMMANVQKQGGVAVLFDSENAVNEEFWDAVGVDSEKLVYISSQKIEDVFEQMEKSITTIRSKLDNEKRVLFVVDSIAQLSTGKEIESGYVKEGYGTDKAQILGKALRKLVHLIGKQKILLVCTNQLRYNLNPQSREKYITPGGVALNFAASLRIRLTRIEFIKKGEVVVGTKVKAEIKKNRFGPPHREVVFDLYFDRGIDDESSWIGFMNDNDIVAGGGGGYYAFTDMAGTVHKFRSSGFKEFIKEHPETYKEMYTRICDTLVMKYKSDGISTVDGTATTEKVEGDD